MFAPAFTERVSDTFMPNHDSHRRTRVADSLVMPYITEHPKGARTQEEYNLSEATSHRSPILRPTDLAERWATSAGRLANMRSAGIGPKYCKIGASIRYRLSDIEAYEEANTVAPLSA